MKIGSLTGASGIYVFIAMTIMHGMTMLIISVVGVTNIISNFDQYCLRFILLIRMGATAAPPSVVVLQQIDGTILKGNAFLPVCQYHCPAAEGTFGLVT